jgi:hypothetical protein
VERQYRVISEVLGEFPHLDIRRVDLRFRTRGAAETLYILLQNMSPHELRRPTISIDCHTFYRRCPTNAITPNAFKLELPQ